ncbi:MAG: TonB-dependent receptor [Cytophagaceae bacterium]|jgi:hypothetical protein|nr:TonB-dependent receptor [Cytophagaceae bacterium]
MKNISKIPLLLFCWIFAHTAASQDLTQTIRGRIVEKNTQEPIPGAHVIIVVNGNQKGAATSADGQFSLTEIPVGRYSLSATALGFAPFVAGNVLVNSGKETVLNIAMEENVNELETVVISAKVEKDQPLNKMAMVSARMFSSDDANRYAGSWGDPARMASNFAGVMAADDSRNDIIIRGNSPSGVLWRLDGFEIPNPNHFGSMGGTGGPVGMINNNQLTNSDFYTGAFPAEFGNATSGVFDLKLRSGNSEKHEFMGSMGFNGFEFGAEGPLSKKTDASYMVNGRYAFMKFLDLVGIDIAGTDGAIPEYRDLTAKVNLPLKSGHLQFVTMMGASHINMNPDMTDSTEFSPGTIGGIIDMTNEQYFAGLNYTHRFSAGTRLENRLSYRYFGSTLLREALQAPDEKYIFGVTSKADESCISYAPTLHHRFNSRNFLQVGTGIDLYRSDLNDVYYDMERTPTVFHNGKHHTALARAYAQWQHRFSDALSITPGMYSQYYALSGEITLEPRMCLKYAASERSSLNLGVGVHSQVTSRQISFYTENDLLPNKDLKMNKSLQAVLGYDLRLAKDMRLKTEIYYQHLYDVPVNKDIPEESLLNYGAGFYNRSDDVFVDGGTGKNYGIDLTVEKFFSNRYYFLITGSLYDAKYTPLDGKERRTAFAGNFSLTTLAGYEWKVFKNDLIAVNLKGSYVGGKRFVPVSVAQGFDEVSDYTRAYAERYPNYFRLDVNISMKNNFKRMAMEWFFEINNVTNHKNIMWQIFNRTAGKYDISYQQGFMPMGGCRVYF